MSNRFIKSQSSVSLSPTETQRLQETQQRERVRQRAEQSISSRPDSPVMRVINRVMDFAAKGGTLSENLFEQLEEIDFLVRLMLVQLTEDEIAEVIHKFRFVRPTPWPIMRELLIAATKAGRQPMIGMKNAIEFAYEHYTTKRNLNLTMEVLEEATRLQPLMPEIRLFSMILDSLSGEGIEDLSVMQFAEGNMDQFRTVQSLLSLVFAKPESDLEQIRINFRSDVDKLQRQREIADAYTAIQDSLLTNEFNRAMTRTVKLLTDFFRLSQNDPRILTVRRIMMLLQMGQEARKQFFSPLESTTIANQPRPGQQQKAPRKMLGNDNYKSIKIAQEEKTNQYGPNIMSIENKTQIKTFIYTLISTIDKANGLFTMSDAQFTQRYPNEPIAYENFKKFKASPLIQKQITSLLKIKSEFMSLIKRLDSPDFNIDTFNNSFFETLNKYIDVKKTE